MKNLKNIALALLVIAGGFAFTSCEDEDKNPVPELGFGGYVKFVEQPFQWDGTAIVFPGVTFTRYNIGDDIENAVFEGVVEDPTGNVVSYEVFVQGDFTGAPDEAIPFRSTTTFPFDVSFTTADMAALFNVDISTFSVNDRFTFTSNVTTSDGTVYTPTPTNCECPAPEDGELVVADPGTWNGGNIDQVLLNGGDTGTNELLPANGYAVDLRAFRD